jgi:L,D-transpeptidase YcbB
MMLGASLPASAQTPPAEGDAANKPADAQPSPTQTSGQQPTQPATEQAPAAQAPADTQAAAPPPPAKPVDPLVAQVRQQLGEAARGPADRAALAAFYGELDGPPLWVTPAGFTPRAKDAMAEIARADDWGLSAAAFELPRLGAGELSPSALADAEIKLGLAILKYARHARGGRIDPAQVSRNFDQKPPLLDPKAVLQAVAATEAPGKYLQSLHPKHEQFVLLRQALLKARAGTSAPAPEPVAEATVRLPDGPTLKLGMEHPQVALLRQRLRVPASAGADTIYDLQVRDAVKAFQEEKGIQPSGQLTPRTRQVLNGGIPEKKPATVGSEVQRITMNMERWRWVPENLGAFHVWDNVPEFQTRVIKSGLIVHQAKIVVGKPDTQTAMFSANMRYVVFGPEWGVPDSIKVKEILPYLRPSYDGGFFGFGGGYDTRVLQRHNLRVSYNGRPVDPNQVNWSQVDIKRFTFIQPSGAANVLGAVKFRFPNKHDIYMHDTPQRELFEKQVRAFSHGCMRVQNPGRLAEILLAEDKGWSADHVRGLMARGGNNEVELSKQIPVHVTYFTAVVGEDGKVHYHGDLYGHDSRMALALSGRALPPEPANVDDPSQPSREARRPGPQPRYKQTNSNDFFSGLFGN